MTTTSFCINTKTLKTCVKSAPHHYAISIESLENSSHIKLTAYESLSNSSITMIHTSNTRFRAGNVQAREEVVFVRDRYGNGNVQRHRTHATDLKGENISIRVRQPKKDLASEPKRQKCDATSRRLALGCPSSRMAVTPSRSSTRSIANRLLAKETTVFAFRRCLVPKALVLATR